MTYRDEKMRVAVRLLPCTLNVAGVACPTGPSVIVHNDTQALGKGIGHKSADIAAAGCPGCHTAVSNGSLTRNESQYYLLRGTVRTVEQLMARGWLKWSVTHKDLERELAASPIRSVG